MVLDGVQHWLVVGSFCGFNRHKNSNIFMCKTNSQMFCGYKKMVWELYLLNLS